MIFLQTDYTNCSAHGRRPQGSSSCHTTLILVGPAYRQYVLISCEGIDFTAISMATSPVG